MSSRELGSEIRFIESDLGSTHHQDVLKDASETKNCGHGLKLQERHLQCCSDKCAGPQTCGMEINSFTLSSGFRDDDFRMACGTDFDFDVVLSLEACSQEGFVDFTEKACEVGEDLNCPGRSEKVTWALACKEKGEKGCKGCKGCGGTGGCSGNPFGKGGGVIVYKPLDVVPASEVDI